MKTFFNQLNIKGHLLTAISYLIPVVCGAGFMIAIGMALGGDSSTDLTKTGYSFWDVLATLGGFLAGYLVVLIIKYIKMPNWAKGLMPMLVIPFIASLIGGLIMVYVIGAPITQFTHILTEYLQSLSGTSKLIYGIIIGVLASVDYGGPINKTVFAFVLTLQAQGIHEPITALIVVNTATPIGFAFAYWIGRLMRKNIYKKVEVETLKTAFPMGIIEIVEGVLPIVLNDIIRCVIATGIGGAVGGAISMVMNADSKVPFGGMLAIPTMSQPLGFVIAIVANVVVTALVLVLLKKPVNESEEMIDEIEEDDIELGDIKVY